MNAITILLLISFSLASCHYKSANELEEETEERSEEAENDCKYEDGTHSATVDYFNPETGHIATYDLEVEVEDCEVTQINFPKGGWMDDDHIAPTALNEDGKATIEDDQGRTWEIQLD